MSINLLPTSTPMADIEQPPPTPAPAPPAHAPPPNKAVRKRAELLKLNQFLFYSFITNVVIAGFFFGIQMPEKCNYRYAPISVSSLVSIPLFYFIWLHATRYKAINREPGASLLVVRIWGACAVMAAASVYLIYLVAMVSLPCKK